MHEATDILFLGVEPEDERLAILREAGYSCLSLPAGTDVLSAINAHDPVVAIVSLAETKDMAPIREIKGDEKASRVPVVAIDIGDAPDALRNCCDAGADDVFEDDAEGPVIVARIQALMRLGGMEAELVRRSATAAEFGIQLSTEIRREARERGGNLLIVGADEPEIEALCPLLAKTDIVFAAEPDPYRARARVEGGEEETFDGALVYVRDEAMREKCEYFCRAVRNDRRLYDLPLFLVAEHGTFPNHSAAYDRGANVVASAPVDCDFVDAHLHLLMRGRDRRRALGRRIAAALGPKTADDIGSIYSEKFARAHLERLCEKNETQGAAASAILFFIPTIGEVAAIYGVDEATMLRQQLANWLTALVRVEDTVARTGTDEFLALMPHTGLKEAELVRRRVVGVLHQSEFRLTDNVPVGIEVYVQSGITELHTDDNLEHVISRASDLLE